MHNVLIVGLNKRPILDFIPNDNFLLVGDGPEVDAVLASDRTMRVFDPLSDRLDPLKDMDARRAQEFDSFLGGTFPEGESTLTKATARWQILQALRDNPGTLEELLDSFPATKAYDYARQLIGRLLYSDVLKGVLSSPRNVSLTGTIVAKLDRAALGDFDAFVIGNLLMLLYEGGSVVVPEFGFYACTFHTKHLRQNRLIAGINALAEVPKLRSELLLVGTKIGSRATAEDADTLATYCSGFPYGTDGYSSYVQKAMA